MQFRDRYGLGEAREIVLQPERQGFLLQARALLPIDEGEPGRELSGEVATDLNREYRITVLVALRASPKERATKPLALLVVNHARGSLVMVEPQFQLVALALSGMAADQTKELSRAEANDAALGELTREVHDALPDIRMHLRQPASGKCDHQAVRAGDFFLLDIRGVLPLNACE